ncbi:signal peptide peptidase SppA [Salinisphaera sp. Q1T1-3]|uniref:signal peptide peptidase SppA n=1 Tax=Salinisphaera sp. Q1T1-3 TaxID=2321229 RepID=UPI000E7598E8|nr:signal peptide peptidase SppA [Salinisphaera sp. Q1T1-3]RJS93826.1 signal peptide peptidase SppA [Salinisphaera sp. Q1T1-3]
MAGQPSFFRRVIGGLWRTVALLYSLLFLAILIAIPVGLYFVFNAPPTPVPQQAVLVVDPSDTLVEQPDVVGSLIGGLFSDDEEPSVTRDIVTALDRAADDDRIKQVLLKLDDFNGATPGQLQDVVAAIRRFKKASDKPVVAWSDGYNQAQYELASQADRIVVDPLGFVLLQGYGVYNNYYKDALDKLGVNVNVFRVGKYKSYVEPYTRNDMSPAARADALSWMHSLWGTYKTIVTADRGIDPDAIDAYIDSYADRLTADDGNAARLAQAAGLVDSVASLDAVSTRLAKAVGQDERTHGFKRVDTADYLADTDTATGDGDRIAVVTVEGDIIDGESTPGSAGGDTIARLIDSARRDEHVAGMVLRVNSPGGSVTAAERIRRQVVAMRAAGKPVVVSMAGLAASGGYWISMNADQIWAEPSTITGSIGIFAIVPTFNEPLNKLGIHTDGVGTTALSGAMRLDRPLSDQARQILQAGIEHGYHQFTSRVAKARDMPIDKVDRIAQGRVWAGADAARIGLVDHLGDVTQAEAAAAKLAGLDPKDYRLQPMTPPSSWRGALSQTLGVHIAEAMLPSWLARASQDDALSFLKRLNDPNGLYARCFCRLDSAGSAAQTTRISSMYRGL